MIYRSAWSLMVAVAVAASFPAAADETAPVLQNRSIAYVLTDEHWALYQTPNGKTECPDGLNDGPREQFKQLFPDNGTQRSEAETRIKREIETWYTTTTPEPF